MNTPLTKPIKMPAAKAKKLSSDPLKSAKAAHLVYVNSLESGIRRVKKGKGFAYIYQGKPVTDKDTLNRIRSLVLPPAWQDVRISEYPDGHLQATGLDARNRKQYRYHPQWNALRSYTKFGRMLLFAEKLPILRLRLEQDMGRKELCQEKVIATVISLMERTYIRIGNNEYEKANGSYGLTTLKDKHVKIDGQALRFSFVGKKGVSHDISLKHRKLARIVKECREIPGKELFQYYDSQGNRHAIDSGKVNAYIKEVTGEDFTAKDFRTWAGSLNALQAFKHLGDAETATGRKAIISGVLDEVSKKLGNTRTVCRKYYVHPAIFDLFEKQSLSNYLSQLDHIEKDDDLTGWTSGERILMEILRTC